MAQATSGRAKRLEISFFGGLNTLAAWNIAKPQELTHVENATGPNIGIVERRKGYRILGNNLSATHNFGLFYFPSTNASSLYEYRVSTVSGTTSIYYLNTSNVWTALTGAGTSLAYTSNNISTTAAENRLYIVNGEDGNRFIAADGTTVTAASTTLSVTNDFFNAPLARKINYYKGRLYLADLTYTGPSGTYHYQNQIQVSSPLLGIVSLVDGDYASGFTSIKVTDTKYIYNPGGGVNDTLDVFRGDVYLTQLTVTAKTETSITCTASPAVALQSADELWVAGTNPKKSGASGIRRFRWAVNTTGGMPVKRYDTFSLTGGNNERITMLTNVGPYMMIGNASSLATWDGTTMAVGDTGIGCVSDTGYTKFAGILYFVHYTGIYSTTGGTPKLKSGPVDAYIKGATKAGLEAAVCGRSDFSVYFHIGTVTLTNPDGSPFQTLTNTVIEYDARMDDWYVYTGIPAAFMDTYINASGDPDQCVFASNTGSRKEVFMANTGEQDDDTAPAPTEIPFRMDTQTFQLCSRFENVAYLQNIVLFTDRGNTVHCFVSLDDEPFYEVRGQFDKGVGVIPITAKDSAITEPPRCHRIRVSLRSYGKARTRISRMAINYFETVEQDENPR